MSPVRLPLFILLVVAAFALDLPSNFEKCDRNKSDFDKCLVDAVNKALVLLKDGNKEFGMSRLEPLHVKSMVIDTGSGSPINLRQTFKEVDVHDLISGSRVVRYRTDFNKHLIICDSKSDRIRVLGDYEMSGRILLLPIVGKGKTNITLVDTHIEHQLIGEPYEKNGVKYMKLREYKVDFKPKRVYMHFENLFNDKVLSEGMNRFIDENWEAVFSGLKEGYSKGFGSIFRDLSNRIFTKVPMDQIFLRNSIEGSK